MGVKNATREMIPFIEHMPDEYTGKMSKEHLMFMVERIINGDMDIEKCNRWLGYIQGVLCTAGVTNVDKIALLTAKYFKKS